MELEKTIWTVFETQDAVCYRDNKSTVARGKATLNTKNKLEINHHIYEIQRILESDD